MSVLGVHWKDWCWSWNSSTLATSCEELTHWKRLWFWEGLGAGGEGDDRGWDGWMASPTRWTWVWVNSGSCWWTGRPGVLQFMGSQGVGHDWVTELNWTDVDIKLSYNHLLKKTVLSPLYKLITLLKINCPYMHTSGNELSISFRLFACLFLYQYNIVLIIVFLK